MPCAAGRKQTLNIPTAARFRKVSKYQAQNSETPMQKSYVFAISLLVIAGFAHSQDVDKQNMGHSTMDHAAHMKSMADAQRQADVTERGKDVMPFSLPETTHIFSKTSEGGVQRVIAKNAGDTGQVNLVRQHLQELRTQFLKGDFSGPSHIHGADMPGNVHR